MRGFVRILMFSFGAVLLLIGAVIAYAAYGNWKLESYYRSFSLQKNMLVSATRADGAIVTTSTGPKQVLLDYIPLGTPEKVIFTKLAAQGFACEYAAGKRETPVIVCYIEQDKRVEYRFRWHIELKIDENQKLSDVRVLIL